MVECLYFVSLTLLGWGSAHQISLFFNLLLLLVDFLLENLVLVSNGLELGGQFVDVFEDESILVLLFQESLCYLLEIAYSAFLLDFIKTLLNFLHTLFVHFRNLDLLLVQMHQILNSELNNRLRVGCRLASTGAILHSLPD